MTSRFEPAKPINGLRCLHVHVATTNSSLLIRNLPRLTSASRCALLYLLLLLLLAATGQIGTTYDKWRKKRVKRAMKALREAKEANIKAQKKSS